MPRVIPVDPADDIRPVEGLLCIQPARTSQKWHLHDTNRHSPTLHAGEHIVDKVFAALHIPRALVQGYVIGNHMG